METISTTRNPIIPNRGICDPHIHIFNNRAYLYASHDDRTENVNYCMKNWHIWSSADLVTWRHESVFTPEETYMGPSTNCWAPDGAERNGTYYFYFSNGMKDTGVAVSNNPGGPFRAALDHPLLPDNLTPTKHYDADVFVDDDDNQTPYIIFGTPLWAGGDSYYIARLNEDMISLAETPRKISLDNTADDKPSLHKHNDRYYLSWQSFYAVSDCVYGPYRYTGNTGAGSDHGNFFQWNNQWFQTYGMYDPTTFHRGAGICYAHFHADGTISTDPMIVQFGVGQYDATWPRIEAEWYMASSGMVKAPNPRTGLVMRADEPDAFLCYPNVYNLRPNPRLAFYGRSSSTEEGVIEVRSGDTNGPLLGQCLIQRAEAYAPDDWRGYTIYTCDLDWIDTTLDLVLIFTGHATRRFELDWLRFY